MSKLKFLAKNTLTRTAREIRTFRRLTRFLVALLSLIAIVLAAVYVITILYNRYGAFTVRLSKLDHVNYALSLSEDRNFHSASSRLNMNVNEEITNISINDLPTNLDSELGGVKHEPGDNFVAYTYFLKNSGIYEADVQYTLYVANMTMNIQEAIRVRLYVDGVPTDYAWPSADGSPEPGTTEFLSREDVTIGFFENMQPEEEHRFTVVLWLEGDDPECLNPILGGSFKIDMVIDILSVEEESSSAANETVQVEAMK